MGKQSQKHIFFIHGAVLLFGLAGLFAKLDIPPTIIVLGRVVFASIALALFIPFTKERLILKAKEYPKFIVLGLVLALHWVSFFMSIQVSNIAVGLLSFSSFTLFTSLLEPLMLKIKHSPKEVLLSIISMIGIYIIVPEFNLDNNITIGVLWGLLSGLTFALLSILNKKFVSDYSSREVALNQDFFAALFLLPFFWFEEFTLSNETLAYLLLLGLVFTALAHSLFIEGMKTVKANIASLIACLEPVYGILFAFLMMNEIPSSNEMIGGVIIILVSVYASVSKSNTELIQAENTPLDY